MRALLILVIAILPACGGSGTNLRAPRAQPQIEAHWRVDDDVGVEVIGVGDGRECSVQGDLGTICVEGLQTAMREGLEGVLAPFLRIAGDGSGTYLARLRIIDFIHGRAADPAVDPTRQTSRLTERPDLELRFSYRFELFDRTGRAVVGLDQTTAGPQPIRDSARDSLPALLELENEVLEEIAAAVDSARLGTSTGGGEAPPTTTAPTPVTTPEPAPATPPAPTPPAP